jgi:hypothetical protein
VSPPRGGMFGIVLYVNKNVGRVQSLHSIECPYKPVANSLMSEDGCKDAKRPRACHGVYSLRKHQNSFGGSGSTTQEMEERLS